MSVAASPGPWYRRLVGYKNNNADDHTSIAALSTAYIEAHKHRIEAILHGSIEHIVVVPSSRADRPFASQPLANVIRRSRPFRALLADGLSWVPSASLARATYDPEVFREGGDLVSGKRVLLLEDLWVSGSHPLSAAGKLLALGASAVMILPVAREVSVDFCGPSHPYIIAMESAYSVDHWPR
ncbi:MAG TPA: hypothetical protein VGM77_07085 [Gemmatimonadales bacterium]|jgi:hypothetical protein